MERLVFLLGALAGVCSSHCLGEFTLCPGGECTMSNKTCGRCSAGQYLCPSDQMTCVASAAAYASCPRMAGTHFDTSLSIEERLDYLVTQVPLADQIAQLRNTAPELTAFGVPSYQWLNDDQHGVARTPARATVFPNGCALGATFSKPTLKAVGDVIGDEARGLHNGFLDSDPQGRQMKCNGCSLTLYAPNLNLVRDPRWGRAQEVFTEDPHLMAELVVGMVTGAQNASEGRPMRVGTCCKHFAAYDLEGIAGEGGTTNRKSFDAKVNARDMWESFMPAFKACVVAAQSSHVMCSYNAVNGVPACANKGLLTTILRDQWNFSGFVVSDYDAWAGIQAQQKYVRTMEDAAAVGINAGLDQEGGNGESYAIEQLGAAIAAGKTTAAAVNQAFRRLFRVRLRLGLLDPPASVPFSGAGAPRYNATELQFDAAHLGVAARAAREAMTLLRNDGAALPLDAASLKKIAIVGPQANESGILFGNYAGSANAGNWGPSLVEAIASRTSASAATVFEPGLTSPGAPAPDDAFAAAKAAAADADAVFVRLGLAFDRYCEEDYMHGHNDFCEKESNDRSSIELPAGQVAMVAALRGAMRPGAKLIAVLVHGSAIALGDATLGALDAVLDAWEPGIAGGAAVAGALFGDFSPAGRTAVTWYRSTSDLPKAGSMAWYADPATGSKGLSYRFFKGDPLFPFGFGLSYTTFRYSGLELNGPAHNDANSTPRFGPCDAVPVAVSVTNTGAVDSDEVVQVYTQQPNATVPAPAVRLAAFKRVHVAAGATVRVALQLLPDTRAVVHGGDAVGDAVYTASSGQVVEPGQLHIFVGGGQPGHYAGTLNTIVTIIGQSPLLQCRQ